MLSVLARVAEGLVQLQSDLLHQAQLIPQLLIVLLNSAYDSPNSITVVVKCYSMVDMDVIRSAVISKAAVTGAHASAAHSAVIYLALG